MRIPSLIYLILFQMLSIDAFSQEDFPEEKDYVHNREVCSLLTQKGSKIYVEANNDATEIHAQNILEKWGFWNVVSKKSGADIVMRIKSKGAISEYMAYAVFIDNKTGSVFYKTPLVNTFGRISFHGKKAVIKKVVRNMKHHLSKHQDYDEISSSDISNESEIKKDETLVKKSEKDSPANKLKLGDVIMYKAENGKYRTGRILSLKKDTVIIRSRFKNMELDYSSVSKYYEK